MFLNDFQDLKYYDYVLYMCYFICVYICCYSSSLVYVYKIYHIKYACGT